MPYSHPQPIPEASLRGARHLLPGAMLFAANAGYVNSIGLGLFRSPVSHMSGTVSYLGFDFATGRTQDGFTSLGILFGFILGACFSGFIVGALQFLPGRRYGLCLGCEAALLAAAAALIANGHRAGIPFASAACGLQNATTSSYCGLTIRTTHVTGTVTDIGVMLGHWFRHRRIELWKLRFLVAVVTSFGCGIWIGAVADRQFGPLCLGVSAAGIAVAGIALWVSAGRSWLRQDLLAPPEPRTVSFSGRHPF